MQTMHIGLLTEQLILIPKSSSNQSQTQKYWTLFDSDLNRHLISISNIKYQTPITELKSLSRPMGGITDESWLDIFYVYNWMKTTITMSYVSVSDIIYHTDDQHN